jgi:nucleoside-triphosphatase
MYPGKKNILLTGFPGVGKTTLIRRISEELKNLHPVGFYTEEIKEEGIRKGFELIGFDGKKGLLSHVDIKSLNRVGKYRVDVKGFEGFLDSIAFFALQTKLIIIDEIGKMECLSPKFKRIIKEILDSEKMVIATIAFKGSGLIDEIKKRKDVKLFEITEKNRDSLLSEIVFQFKYKDSRI